jgi:hypothetical protein
LDRLTQRLLQDMDQQGARAVGPDCLRTELLGRLASGRLDAHTRERVETHLDGCLNCLDRFIGIRDDIQALTAPGEVSPRLAQALDALLGGSSTPEPLAPRAGRIRRVLAFRVPAWAVAGAAAAILLAWVAADRLHRPGAPMPPSSGAVDTERAVPAHTQLQRTVSGVVSSVRDATSNGVEAHIVDLRDASGASYVLFTWGRPTVRAGDAVEIDAIFTTGGVQAAGAPVYQGVATALRKAR